MATRIRSLLYVATLALLLAACGAEGPTLVSADATDSADAVVGQTDESLDEVNEGPVAEDSPPVARDEEEEFLLFQYMSRPGRSNLGEASFALVGPDGAPEPSEDSELPIFLIRLTAWSDLEGEPVYTLEPRNVAIADGVIVAEGCGTWGGFEKLSSTEFVYTPNQFPKIDGPELAADSIECARSTENITLFEVPVTLDFVEDGFFLTSDEGHMARFQQVAITPPPPPTTLVIPETTVLQAPTTGAPATTAGG